jgi:hypothetical protein
MVVRKGGCVVDGVFVNRPAFALLEATSVFFILAVLFVPMAGGGGDADLLTGVFFLCQVVLHPCCRLILFLIHVCRVDSAAFPVIVPADSVSGFVGCRHRPVAANEA